MKFEGPKGSPFCPKSQNTLVRDASSKTTTCQQHASIRFQHLPAQLQAMVLDEPLVCLWDAIRDCEDFPRPQYVTYDFTCCRGWGNKPPSSSRNPRSCASVLFQNGYYTSCTYRGSSLRGRGFVQGIWRLIPGPRLFHPFRNTTKRIFQRIRLKILPPRLSFTPTLFVRQKISWLKFVQSCLVHTGECPESHASRCVCIRKTLTGLSMVWCMPPLFSFGGTQRDRECNSTRDNDMCERIQWYFETPTWLLPLRRLKIRQWDGSVHDCKKQVVFKWLSLLLNLRHISSLWNPQNQRSKDDEIKRRVSQKRWFSDSRRYRNRRSREHQLGETENHSQEWSTQKCRSALHGVQIAKPYANAECGWREYTPTHLVHFPT